MMDEVRPSTVSPQPTGEPPAFDAGRFGARGPWRHWALWLILAILALHSLRTFDTYLVSDDLKWVQRSAADASRPWNTFVEPLFGDYYRPMPHLMWLANYYIWGFNFRGYQLIFIALWLGIVALVYTLGSRLGGRGAGATAAALVGLHGVYLMIASWKSWYTTTTELAAVLACIRCLCEWVDTRERRWLAWTVATGIVAVLSRELAPLVISAAVFATVVLPAFGEGRERRRAAWLGAAAWAAVTAAVLMALPSYRHMAFGALAAKSAAAATPAPAEGGPGLGNFLGHFRTHTQSIFFGGVWAWLLLTALVWEIGARLKPGAADEATPEAARDRRERFIVGAFVLGGILLALPLGAAALGESAQRNAEMFVLPAVHGLLLLFFLATAWTGDRWDRMLALWFVVAFAPILVLEHGSGAYHMLAYTALALYAARTLWRRATPDAVEFLRDWRGALRACDARTAVCGVLVVAAAGQFYVLTRNLSDVGGALDDRARHGRAMERAVDATVAALKTASDGRAFTVNEPYAELAGLILQKRHGFTVEPLGERVGLRRADLPLPVYSGAVVYSDELFRRCNVFPDPGFEQAAGGIPTAEPGRSGRRAAVASAQGESKRNCVLDLGPFGLRPGTAVVFGGFLRIGGEAGGTAGMALRSEKEGSGRYLVRTQRVAAPQAEWRLVWACAAPAGDERYFLRVIDGEKLRNARVAADDVFLCPVEMLMAGERR